MRVIKEHAINMVRIESRPLLGNPWEYYFYVDLDGNLADPRITETLAELKTIRPHCVCLAITIVKKINSISSNQKARCSSSSLTTCL